MICSSYIRLVKEDLTKIGITVIEVKLGEATIIYDPEIISITQIEEAWQNLGMELCKEQR